MATTPPTVQAPIRGVPGRPLAVERQAWGFSSKGTLSSTHAVHPYVASMNPHLARELVARLAAPGKPLLDPFVGGGAVLVEGLRAGVPSNGLDVNPLAVLLSRVKTTHIPAERLESAYRKIVAGYEAAPPIDAEFPPGMKIDFWFKPETAAALARLRAVVADVPEGPVADAFKAILSGVVRDVSLTYRGEVRLRRLQGRDLEQFKPDVLGKFHERARLAIGRISALPAKPRPVVEEGSILQSPYGDDQFGAIVCSPPYADDRNGVGYFQFSKNMLFWLGSSEESLRQARSRFLGHNPGTKARPASAELARVLEGIEANPVPSNPRATQECLAFYSDYQQALREMARVCDGPIAIVIGDRTLSQTFIDNAAITTDLMETAGCRLRQYFFRSIDKKRIPVMKPGGGQRDRSGGGLINKEHTLIYERA